MAVNENMIKNMANEVTREAQAQNVAVDPNFALYLVELFLLNPKYGKLFTKAIKRKNLEFFVNEIVTMLVRGDISISVMKMQFTMISQYDRLNALIDRQTLAIEEYLRPLQNEILDEIPDLKNKEEMKKLLRKISLYIILATGLGDPTNIQTLKEGLAALESVLSLDELTVFVRALRSEKLTRLLDLSEIVGGVRLFNRDCMKGGEGITDLPVALVVSGKTCLTVLSNTMMSIVQRVHRLTAVVDHVATIDHETGNVCIQMKPGFSQSDYDHVFDLLALNRQYEVFVRTLLMDTETLVKSSTKAIDRAKKALKETHEVVEYRTGVPIALIYPLFSKNWYSYRDMQNIMFLVSTINLISSQLAEIHDEIKPMSQDRIDEMIISGPPVEVAPHEHRGRAASQMIMKNFISQPDTVGKDSYLHLLGFCSLCLVVGALVPSCIRAGVVHARGQRFGFCTPHMTQRFAMDPERYINEVLEYVRNHPHLIRLLKVYSDVEAVRDIDQLTVKRVPKVKVADCGQQTEHPVDSYIDRDYSWNMWEWKRRACLWATLVNCKTHASQTMYSHHRAEIQCQTVELRDKSLQTKKDTGVNTLRNNYFLWGLRGQLGMGQHMMDLTEIHSGKKLEPTIFETCSWPCLLQPRDTEGRPISEEVEYENTHFVPDDQALDAEIPPYEEVGQESGEQDIDEAQSQPRDEVVEKTSAESL